MHAPSAQTAVSHSVNQKQLPDGQSCSEGVNKCDHGCGFCNGLIQYLRHLLLNCAASTPPAAQTLKQTANRALLKLRYQGRHRKVVSDEAVRSPSASAGHTCMPVCRRCPMTMQGTGGACIGPAPKCPFRSWAGPLWLHALATLGAGATRQPHSSTPSASPCDSPKQPEQ